MRGHNEQRVRGGVRGMEWRWGDGHARTTLKDIILKYSSNLINITGIDVHIGYYNRKSIIYF